jgi:hypothetical protein
VDVCECVGVWVCGCWGGSTTELFPVNAFLLFSFFANVSLSLKSFCLDNALFPFQHVLGRIPGP